MGAPESVEGCKDPRNVEDGSHASSPSRFLRILQTDFQVVTQIPTIAFAGICVLVSTLREVRRALNVVLICIYLVAQDVKYFLLKRFTSHLYFFL